MTGFSDGFLLWPGPDASAWPASTAASKARLRPQAGTRSILSFCHNEEWGMMLTLSLVSRNFVITQAVGQLMSSARLAEYKACG
ncbi:MAG: hypothetical protein EBW73_04510 [Betaproteobacteria bacterium]|nr:hypothetical protein [Betaproteobacteria bacterium]